MSSGSIIPNLEFWRSNPMLKRPSLFIFAAIVLLLTNLTLPYSVTAQTIPGTGIPTSVTRLMITNATSTSPVLYLTLPTSGTQDGCTTLISNISVLGGVTSPRTPTQNGANTSQGFISLAPMTTYEIVSTENNPFPQGGAPAEQNCLQGLTFTIAAPPDCPVAGFPNGINQFEATINLSGTVSNNPVGHPEASDITCVNGANAIFQVTITAPVGDPMLWTYDATKTIPAGGSVTSENSWVNVAGKCDDNCSQVVGGVTTDRPWVYPFGCTQCNRLPDPAPPCGQFCAAQNGLPPNSGCLVQRSPNGTTQTQEFGGTIAVNYVGPAIPPATCPGSGGGGGGGGGGNNKHSQSNFCIPVPKKPITAKELRLYYELKAALLNLELRYHLTKNDFAHFERPIQTCPPGYMMF
jgi:hypothetical protein